MVGYERLQRLQKTARGRRKLKNQKLKCECSGWWFPHRRGSNASDHAREVYGTGGCRFVETPAS
jgi:hypothetical protein